MVCDDKPVAVDSGADFLGVDDVHVAIVSGLFLIVQLNISMVYLLRLEKSIGRREPNP